jgi:ribosomal protection tetracycline resistance protein
LGSVDKGTSKTDNLEVERSRGISVRSAYTSMQWKNSKINIIDTPGHVDFSADVERSLRIMDCAIILLSAVEGVQAHTITIWNTLKNLNIPVIFFINKIDRTGADTKQVIQSIKEELNAHLIILQEVTNEGENEANIKSIWNETYQCEEAIEALAETDDNILELYMNEEKTDFSTLNKHLSKSIKDGKIFPLIVGSAKYSIGINNLLDAIIEYFPERQKSNQEKTSALIFSITHDKQLGKIAHVKLYSGNLKNRDNILNTRTKEEVKITQIIQNTGGNKIETGNVSDGDIAGLCGLNNIQVGDILGIISDEIPIENNMRTPLLTVQVIPENEKDFPKLAYALQELSTEDPSLDFDWLKEEQELHVKIMGWIQIQVLEKQIENRYGILAKFKDPTVIYKETPSKIGEGYVRYWMPKPCWAIMKFKIEPGKRGSGIKYHSIVSVDKIQLKYQKEVERTIPKALKQGIKGWEVTDLKITLIEGEDHPVHSKAGDFAVATPMGIMEGLKEIGTAFLEPILSFRITASEELLGNIASDITQMRGKFDFPKIEDGKFIMNGKLPLSTSLDYPVKLASRSGGKASIFTKLLSYELCDESQGVKREFQGISPLDTAKYILKARKAIK